MLRYQTVQVALRQLDMRSHTHYAIYVNTLRFRHNNRHLAQDIFPSFCLNGNVWTLLKMSLKCVTGVRINDIPVLVQIMVWRWPGDKPLSDIFCVTRTQWVKSVLQSQSGEWTGETLSIYSPVLAMHSALVKEPNITMCRLLRMSWKLFQNILKRYSTYFVQL